jgi:phage terminase small subunit
MSRDARSTTASRLASCAPCALVTRNVSSSNPCRRCELRLDGGGITIAGADQVRKPVPGQPRVSSANENEMAGVKGRSGGRNRKSAEQHALEGTHRADRHGPLPETPPADVAPSPIAPPPGLVAAEREYWEYFAPLLHGAKLLTPADRQTLADYCRACVAVDERSRRVRTEFRRRVLDNQTARMLDAQLRGWVQRKTALAGELGLTAASRTRVGWTGHHQDLGASVDEQQKPQSELGRLQQQAKALRRPVGVK